MHDQEPAASIKVHVVDHPLAQHKLTLMRDRSTGTHLFRALLRETGMLLAYAVTRDLPLESTTIDTPLESMAAPRITGKKLALISVLRAGNGLVDGFLEVIPAARVGHLGMQRDPRTLEAHEYYLKLPPALDERDLIVVDPMLATAHTAIAAVDRLRAFGPRSMRFACLLAAPEGLERFHHQHPDVPVYTVAIDRQLNEKGYILPGLGDAGDRLYGT